METLLLYLVLACVAFLGGAAAYWVGHRRVLAAAGVVVGVVLFVVAYVAVSNASMNGAGEISWRILLELIAVAIAVLYSLGYLLGVALRHRTDRRSRHHHAAPGA